MGHTVCAADLLTMSPQLMAASKASSKAIPDPDPDPDLNWTASDKAKELWRRVKAVHISDLSADDSPSSMIGEREAVSEEMSPIDGDS